jgi:hypothetical protein
VDPPEVVVVTRKVIRQKMSEREKRRVKGQGTAINMVKGEVAVFRKNASVYFEEDARVGFVCDGGISKENGTRIEVKNGKISTFLEGQKIAFENDCEVEFLGIAKIRVDIPVEKEPPKRLSKKLDMNGRIGQNKFKKDKVATYQPNTTLFISKFAEIELQQRTKCLFEKPTTILNRYGLVFLTESGKIYEFRKMDTLVFPEQPAMMTIKKMRQLAMAKGH